MHIRIKYILLVIACFALVMSPLAAAQDDTPQRGGVVRGVCVAPITSLDPQTSQLGVCDSAAYEALYNTLLNLTSTGEIAAEIATDWTVSDDGLTYTFTIRDDVMFHDGTMLDAEAVKISVDRLRDPDSASPIAGNLSAIESVNVIDETTVEIVLSAFNAPFLSNLTGVQVFSPAALDEFGEDFQFNPVGSGPFQFVSWTPGDVAVFERNENYWEIDDSGEALPYLDGVELNGLDDETVRLLNLRSGEFDLNERLNVRDVEAVQGDETLQVLETSTATAYAVTFNLGQPPFDNLALRQAVQHALDGNAIIDNLSFSTGYPSAWPFPRDTWYFFEGSNPEYNLERARELLVEAGYPDGLNVTLTHISRAADAQIAQIVQAQLAQIGINVEIQALERTTWLDIWLVGAGENTEGELAIFQNTVGLGDPDVKAIFLEPGGIVNFADFNDEETWSFIEASRQTIDLDERAANWNAAVQSSIDNAAYVWFGNVPLFSAARANVQNIELNSSAAWILTRTWLADE